MRKLIKVACAQVRSEKSDEKSLDKLLSILDKKSECDLIVFPEFYFSQMNKKIINGISDYVSQNRITVIFGGVEREGEKLYDSAYCIEFDRIFRYRKTHVHWTEKFDPGKKLEVFETSLGKIGILICFDSTFVETSRVLALLGAEIIVIIAASPAYFDVKISLVRIQANACENQVFIIYVNKPLKDGCSGNSMIVNAKGRTISSAGSVETIITGDLNSEDLREWREMEHIFPNRKPHLYNPIIETIDKNGKIKRGGKS